MQTMSSEQKILAGISYCFWPLSLFVIFTQLKKERFLRFHCYQSLFLGISSTVGYLVIGGILRIIPFIGIFVFNLLIIVWFLFVVFLCFRCLQGDYFRVPLIYDLAQSNME